MKEDKEKLAGLSGALLVMPLYMLSLLFLLFALWQSTGFESNPHIIKLLLFALLILFGISVRSWQCIGWIKSDPHRATAMGKKLFLIFIILSSLDTLIVDWPTSKFEGPLTALSTEQVSYGYYGNKQLYVVDPEHTQVFEAGFWAWLSFLFTFVSRLVEELVIFAFISVLYTRLRGNRPEFTWSNFIHEVSWGKWGAEYKWNQIETQKANKSQ